TREIGKEMIARGSGKIVFTASLLTFQGGITVPGYAASKGAIGSLTKAFANEWASKGVNVNAIAPGYIATDNTEALREDAERSASILGRIPAGRWGGPEDFKGPAVSIASNASYKVHATILTGDGGWMGRKHVYQKRGEMLRYDNILASFLTILLPRPPSVMQRHEIFVASSSIRTPIPLKDGH